VRQLKAASIARPLLPGVVDLTTTKADTQADLMALRSHMRQALGDGIEVSTAEKTFDAGRFMHLRNATEPKRGNASLTHLEVERA